MPAIDFLARDYWISVYNVLSKFEVRGNNVFHLLLVFVLTALLYWLIWKSLGFIKNKLHKIQLESVKIVVEPVSQALDGTKSFFVLLLSVFISINYLSLHDAFVSFLAKAFTITLFIQIALWLDTICIYYLTLKFKKSNLDQESGDGEIAASSYWLMSFFCRVIIWLILILLLLDNLGINITALVAGLGVGGVAVALAVQNILGDLFCSLSILLDKPFEIGDFIVVDDMRGTVEKIGIKSTRIRSLSGEQIVVSNSDLIQKRIKNFKRMNQRRIVFTVGVTYQTPADKVKAIPALLQDIIQSHEKTRFDRAHFQMFAESALLFEIVYFVLSSEYNEYMDIQQAINLAIYEKFEQENIQFAYPTQTVFLEKCE